MKTVFAINLAKWMKERGLSQSELSRRSGITQSSISDYLRGKYEPKQDKVDLLADALNVSPSLLIGTKSADKKPIIKSELPSNFPIETFMQLNLVGQEKVADYANYLIATGQYKRSEPLQLKSSSPTYRVSGRAAAGNGVINHDHVYTYRRIRMDDAPDHDAMIEVDGDSMEPTIKDGDIAFVIFSADFHEGNVYAVAIGEETVIKRCYRGEHGLILVSDNDIYPPRELSPLEMEDTRIVGEVVGWTSPD